MIASVIVPSFRGASRLPRLLESLCAQRLEPNPGWEAIIVLDGVEDQSPDVLAGYSRRLNLRVITFERNRGRSAALNAGFAAAQGAVLIRCDDDLRPQPDFVARHVMHHRAEPVGAVGLCPNVATGSRYDEVYGRDAARRAIAAGYGLPARRRWSLWAANCSVTRMTFDLVGPYDEEFRKYGWEDIDWGYRLHLAGLPIVVDTALEAAHCGAPTTAVERIGRAFASGQAMTAFENKHGIRLASSSPTGFRPRAWTVGVSAGARLRGERSFARLARAIDWSLPRVPPPVGRILVAFGVESAGRAGHAQGEAGLPTPPPVADA